MERLSDKQEHDIINYGECIMYGKVEKFEIIEEKNTSERIVEGWYDHHSKMVKVKQVSNGNTYSFQYGYLVQNNI